LYNEAGALQHVGVCGSFSMAKRVELVNFLAPYRIDALKDHPWKSMEALNDADRVPGGQSRWSQGKDLSWEPLRPELVVEVAYEHMQGDRFRHMAQFQRWRDDKRAADCNYAQLEVVPPEELAAIFSKES
jgi:ATP-dependent DNA ligase